MNDFPPDPPRWRDRENQANIVERAAGQVVRALEPPAPLSLGQLARIKGRVSSRPDRRFPFRFWVTVTAALLLGGATAAAAARLDLLPGWLTGVANSGASQDGPAKRRPSAKRTPVRVAGATLHEGRAEERAVANAVNLQVAPPAAVAPGAAEVAAEVVDEAKVVVPAPTKPQTVSENRSRRPPRGDGRLPLPADEPDRSFEAARPLAMVPAPRFEPGRLIPAPALAPARERTLDAVAAFPFPSSERSHAPAQTPNPEGSSAKPLADAIRALRTEHDPGRALALLDEHRAELARGSFGHEALLVRVEALLALHREGEVLMLLDATALAEVAASRSLRLTRAELRAAAGRCVEALEDFELVLARTTDERAVRGRDACRKRLAASGDPGNIRP